MAIGARSSSLAQLIQDGADASSAVLPTIKKALNDVGIPRARAGSGGTGILTGVIDVLGDPAGTPKAEANLSKDQVTPTGITPTQTKSPTPPESAFTTPSKRPEPTDQTAQLTPEQKRRLGLFG